MTEQRRSGAGVGRSRWAAFGAAVAVAVGAGGILTASASTGAQSAFVPISPCRLVDTRPDQLVGLRGTPLGPDETHTVTATGLSGNCTIPAEATALVMNVVAVAPTASSYLTVFPGGEPRPLASSLNVVAGQPPTPNGVTAKLGAGGGLSFYNLAGSVHLVVDVAGYYAPVAGSGGPIPDGGPRPARVVWVATDGGDFISLSAALAAITGAGPATPWLIKVAPGTYVEPATVELRAHVDIEGSGEGTTVIEVRSDEGMRALGASPAEVRSLTLRVAPAPGTLRATGVSATYSGAGPTLQHVTVEVKGAAEGVGVYAGRSRITVRNTTVAVAGAESSVGVWASIGGATVRDSTIAAARPLRSQSADVRVVDTLLDGSLPDDNTGAGGSRCVGAYTAAYDPLPATCL